MDTIKHKPSRLYNSNETGITIVQHKHKKILGLKGKHHISSVQSAERGSLVTVVKCVSPNGQFIPPLLVFPIKNMKQELINGTPPGSIHACHPSGWIQSEISSQWFLHFISHTKLTKEDPVILVLDGHYSHTGNLEVITLARQNHIDIICLPPPSNHKMQPLDKTFMGSLKTFCWQEIEKMALFTPSASHHHRPNWGTIWKCIQASCNRRNSCSWFPGDRPLSLWQEHLQTIWFPSVLRGQRCCSCEPSSIGKDQRSTIIQFC